MCVVSEIISEKPSRNKRIYLNLQYPLAFEAPRLEKIMPSLFNPENPRLHGNHLLRESGSFL